MENIYILYCNNEPVIMSGRHKRIYTSLDNAKNAIRAISQREARLGIKNWEWLKMDKKEKHELVNIKAEKYSIGLYRYDGNIVL